MALPKRIEWVDIYKGIAIALIVIGHTSSSYGGYIYLFHVPAFFFISGYTSNFNRYSFSEFFIKRLKNLIAPYFIFNIIFLFLHVLLKLLNVAFIFYHDASNTSFHIITNLNGLLTFSFTEEIGGATWFLIVLFEAQLTCFFLVQLVNKFMLSKKTLLLSAFSFLIIGYVFYNKKYTLSYMLDLNFIASFFLILGYLAKDYFHGVVKKLIYITFPLQLGVLYYLKNYHFVGIEFPSRTFDSWYLVILSSFTGILALYAISNILTKIVIIKNALIYVGRSTLWILCLHFFAFKIMYGILFILGVISFKSIQQLVPRPENNYWILLSVWGILLPLGIKIIYKKLYFTIVKIYRLLENNSSRISHLFFTSKFLLFILTISTIILQSWVLNKNNFFYADDFGHFWAIDNKPYSHFFYFIPKQMYNDRPLGQVFLKVLVDLFGFNNVLHHVVLLLIHVFNSILVYFFIKKLTRLFKQENTVIAFLSALLFANWPKSLFAIRWDAAIFDLLGCFFFLLFLNIFIITYKKKNIFLSILLIPLYILMMRIKEAVIFTPAFAFSLMFLHKEKERKLQNIAENKIFILILLFTLILMTGFLLYLFYLAKISHFMGYDIHSPYHSDFSPKILLRNFLRYIYIYINIKDYNQVFISYTKIGIILTLGSLVCIIFPLFDKTKKALTLCGISGLIITLLPVLHLDNMQHRLYLYIPSIFLSFLLIQGITSFINLINKDYHKNDLYLIGLIVIILVYVNIFYSNMTIEKNWWLTIGGKNRVVFNNLKSQKLPRNIKTVYIVNDNEITSIFKFGQGDVLKLLNNRSLDVKFISEKESKLLSVSNSAFVLNYKQLQKISSR